jgi:hypothetical protein
MSKENETQEPTRTLEEQLKAKDDALQAQLKANDELQKRLQELEVRLRAPREELEQQPSNTTSAPTVTSTGKCFFPSLSSLSFHYKRV